MAHCAYQVEKVVVMRQRTLIILGVMVVALSLGCAFISEPDVGTSASGPDIYDDNGSFGEASGDGSDPYLNGTGVPGEDGASVPSNGDNTPPDSASEPDEAGQGTDSDFADATDATVRDSFNDAGTTGDSAIDDLEFGVVDAGILEEDANLEDDGGP